MQPFEALEMVVRRYGGRITGTYWWDPASLSQPHCLRIHDEEFSASPDLFFAEADEVTACAAGMVMEVDRLRALCELAAQLARPRYGAAGPYR